MTIEVISQLESSRKELLDLGLRNSLLNHRRRAKQISIIDEISAEIYRILVIDGREMTFEALPDEQVAELSELDSSDDLLFSSIDWGNLIAQPDERQSKRGLPARHVDNKLQTSLSSAKLQIKLLSIHNDARTYMEEQGVNILFIALGFLHWYESPSAQELRRAPLILIPVTLRRTSAKERFRVSYSDEEIGDNLSLTEKLKSEFGLHLPRIDDPEELNANEYFSLVSGAIGESKRWKVEPNEITLGFFSFGKFLMYRDLDPTIWPEDTAIGEHNVLSALLADGFKQPKSDYHDETRIDDVISAGEMHQVKDADSSQILAILDVMSGKNMVLQGPPGTGKSQTIMNIIAECLAGDRKVLFVSEKMAALDVVKRRLDGVGLGDSVLELHSYKTNKKQVLEELNRTLHQGRPILNDSDETVVTLGYLCDKLNAYSDAVNQPIGNTRINFINALGHSISTFDDALKSQIFDFAEMSAWDESEYRSSRLHVGMLARYLEEVGSPDSNPFKLSKLKQFLPSQRSGLKDLLKEGKKLTNELIASSSGLCHALGLNEAVDRREVNVLCKGARRVLGAPNLDGPGLISSKWKSHKGEINTLLESGRRLSQLHERFDDVLTDEAWEQDLIEVRKHVANFGRKWWRFMSGDYRRASAKLQQLGRQAFKCELGEKLEILDAVLDGQAARRTFGKLAPLGKSVFGFQWTDEWPNWDILDGLNEWITALHTDEDNDVIPKGIAKFLSEKMTIEGLKDQTRAVEGLLVEQGKITSKIADLLELRIEPDSVDHWDMTMRSQSEMLDWWHKNTDSLFHLMRYRQIEDEMKDKGLDFVLNKAIDWHTSVGSLIQLFDYSWYNGLVEKAYVEIPGIQIFDRVEHEHTLKEFSRLDRLMFQYNRARLAESQWRQLPSLSAGGELQIISREVNKKRRIMPIRRLIKEAGRAIQAIKPVFMMSPMSIATYIPPGSLHFDLVVFDEASQVKPVDAFGAIVRGNQTVVVGDSKQLPPTAFFDSVVEREDEDEEIENVGDMESILKLFLGKGAPERMLRWHYRSKHHSLIAVSNHEFYDSKLFVFPSPGLSTIARGLRLIHLPHTTYDRGKTRTNSGEALAIAEAVIKHAIEYPDLSLGVAAFSVAQRDAIELNLEILRRENPNCELFFDNDRSEPFFVKNLENVQGDERDVIFISVGYGKTSEGFMPAGFGPLNRDGGERRLNVLISRAKLAMDVYSNFKAADIDLTRSNTRGVVALKNFLAFAETGILEQPYSTGKEPDSPFEEAVMKALTQRGIEVEPQVGTAGFFIDIAVKDPDKPGRYILGIECDGAAYHSSRSARDRDRLRQEVLEGLGWRLHRIWSTAWYKNSDKELDRALIACQRAKEFFENTPELTASAASGDGGSAVTLQREDASALPKVVGEIEYNYYEKALVEVYLGGRQLHELSIHKLSEYIKTVVIKESPVHYMEVIHRITEGAGLKRSGNRIQKAVMRAINSSIGRKELAARGKFLWMPEMSVAPIRNRSKFDSNDKKLEWVSPAEISEALISIVTAAFSLAEADAISGTARALGFKRVTASGQKIMKAVLNSLIKKGRVVRTDGVVTVGN